MSGGVLSPSTRTTAPVRYDIDFTEGKVRLHPKVTFASLANDEIFRSITFFQVCVVFLSDFFFSTV